MATTLRMPALSPTMEEGKLARWLVSEGDVVEPGDLLAEIETDKAVMELEAVDQGTVFRILVPEGSAAVKINTAIAIIAEEGEDVADDLASETSLRNASPDEVKPAAIEDSLQVAPVTSEDVSKDNNGARIFASPLARRLAAEHGIDLAALNGSGPRGRIVKRDIEGALVSPARQPASPAISEASMPSGLRFEQVCAMFESRDFEVVELDGMRRTVAARLTEAKQTIPHFYLRRRIAIDRLLGVRVRLNDSLAKSGIKLSINDFIIAAVAKALQDVPEANVAWADGKMLRFRTSDVAVAVAVDGGLFTPVILNAEGKSIVALSAEMKDLAQRARRRRLKPHEYVGGSCTISNLGMYGIENFDAVINPPQGSILAVGAGSRQPVYNDNGDLVPKSMMAVTLSVDHRVIDGAVGASFLDSIVRHIEEPLMLMIDVS